MTDTTVSPATEANDLQAVPLPPKVHEILAGIDDVALRGRVEATVRLALIALDKIARVYLPQDNFEERRDADEVPNNQYVELAPYVLAAVEAINRLLTYLMQTYPVPDASLVSATQDSFDLEFDLVDGPIGQAQALAPQTTPTMSQAEAISDAVHAYGPMLRSRVAAFGDRLKNVLLQGETWPLLAELDDSKHRLSKAVQGVLFGVLGVFAATARREEIFPAYRSAVGESVQLRSALSELSFHVNKFNAAIAKATSGEALPLVVALADRLARFAVRPEYRTLRAEDKRAIIDFRRTLYDMRHRSEGVMMGSLKMAVEGFSKFLESMQAINHREVLVLHDRQRLQEALERLEFATDLNDLTAACGELDNVIAALGTVQGRSPDLDDARRNYFPVEADAIGSELVRWRALVENATAMVR